MKLLAATGDGELERSDSTDGRPREDGDLISGQQSRMNDRAQSPYLTAARVVTALKVSAVVIDGQFAALVNCASMISKSNDPRRSQQVAEVADGKQE